MKVKEHIRRSIYTVHEHATFREALQKMVQEKTNGLIVLDDEEHAIGILDSFMLIKAMVPTYLQDDPTLARFEPEGVFYKAVSSALNTKVCDIMKHFHGVSVYEDDPILLAATLASKLSVQYIPVLDDTDRLVGLVSRTDIKRAMAEILHIADPD